MIDKVSAPPSSSEVHRHREAGRWQEREPPHREASGSAVAKAVEDGERESGQGHVSAQAGRSGAPAG